jgi:hypothetical protein
MTTSAKSLLGLAWGLLGHAWVLRNTDVDEEKTEQISHKQTVLTRNNVSIRGYSLLLVKTSGSSASNVRGELALKSQNRLSRFALYQAALHVNEAASSPYVFCRALAVGATRVASSRRWSLSSI